MNKIKYIVLSVCIVLSTQTAMADCIPSSKGDSILKNMILKYQSFLEYNDNGSVYIIRNKNKEEKNKFSTHFEVPDKFTFQWIEKDIDSEILKNKIWGENQRAYFLSYYDKKPEKMSTSNALSSAAGVSRGVSFKVLPWLLFNIDPCSTIGRTKNKLLKEEKYLSHMSYVVERIIEGGTVEKYWISKNKLLLQKIESKYSPSYKMGDVLKVILYENINFK